MKFVQMEFDFSEPRVPETPCEWNVMFTKGWDGIVFEKTVVSGTCPDACECLAKRAKELAPKTYVDAWTATDLGDGRGCIVDFGDHFVFGKVVSRG